MPIVTTIILVCLYMMWIGNFVLTTTFSSLQVHLDLTPPLRLCFLTLLFSTVRYCLFSLHHSQLWWAICSGSTALSSKTPHFDRSLSYTWLWQQVFSGAWNNEKLVLLITSIAAVPPPPRLPLHYLQVTR